MKNKSTEKRTPTSSDLKYSALTQRMDSLQAELAALKDENAALRKSEERFRFLAEKMGDIIWTTSKDLMTIYVSPAVTRILGFTPEERMRQPLDSVLTPRSLERVIEVFHKEIALEDEGKSDPDRVVSLEVEYNTKDGSTVWMENIIRALRGDQGELTGFYGISRNISDRKTAEQAFFNKTEEMERFFDSSLSILCLIDFEGKFIRLNPEWSKNMGYSMADLEKKRFFDLVYPEDREDTRMALSRLSSIRICPVYFENRYQHRDGSYRWMEWRAVSHLEQIYAFGNDLTDLRQADEERERLYAQLFQARKMESIGRLAGGVAHDYNNMLTVILGNVDMALKRVDPKDPLHMDLSEIRKAAEHSADMTRQLLAFSRRQIIHPRVLCLNMIIEDIFVMLRQLVGQVIDLVWEPFQDLWPVKADPSQIRQIMTNLCVNAREAISGGGTVTIKTANAVLDDSDCGRICEATPGDYVLLSISDTGCGMDLETLAHLFEPFFTTKKNGTGLGMPMIYGMVRQNGGVVDVDSAIGRGTSVRIYLPRCVSREDTAWAVESTAEPARGHETILLVDDEASIRNVARKMIESLGYRVLTAERGADALDLLEDPAQAIHLLIMDVKMPEMSGPDLVRRCLALRKDLKYIYMSGYGVDAITLENGGDATAPFVQKPIDLSDLSLKILQALGHPV